MSTKFSINRNIYLIGPHSTGKSYLAKALSEYYKHQVPLLQETARQVLKIKGYTKDDIESPKCIQMQEDILKAQFAAENHLLEKDQNFISDRSGIDPVIYAIKYSPSTDDWMKLCTSNEWRTLVERYRNPSKSLIILLEPCPEFLRDDGTRKLPNSIQEWEDFSQYYESFMKIHKIHFVKMDSRCKNVQERIQLVTKYLGEES